MYDADVPTLREYLCSELRPRNERRATDEQILRVDGKPMPNGRRFGRL